MARRQAASDRTRVRRLPEKGVYDRGAIDAILDAGLVSHLGYVHDGQPVVTPTLHARVGDVVYVHGSSAARSLRLLGKGLPCCLTVTLLDGIVLARSVFEHSVNYRSVMVFGEATLVGDPAEKLGALEEFTEKVLPGRWRDARLPTATELKATAILSLPLDEASGKVAAGGPDDDDSEDALLPIWAGVVPLAISAGRPVPAAGLHEGIPVPPYAADYRRPGLTWPPE
ncbi:MAG: pyridoxamine 5'-phosphate oxidase family protein [Gaiella sp.]